MESDSKVERFVLLGKTVRGRSAAELIKQATAEPGLFAFGELLELPAIQQLKDSEFAQWYRMLELFAYGAWEDYKGSENEFPELNDRQKLKLRQLTVVSLASQNKVLPYSVLLAKLDIPNVRQLEDLLITECFYLDLVKGKLDQKKGCLIVHDSICRDIKREEVKDLMTRLAGWLANSQGIVESIQQKIDYTQQAAQNMRQRNADFEAEKEKKLKAIKDSEMRGPNAQDILDMIEDDRSGRSKRHRTRP